MTPITLTTTPPKPVVPTCFDCALSHTYAGFAGSREEPPEPPAAECSLESGSLLQERCGEAAAPHCPHFTPIMARPCMVCGAAINQPAYTVQFWILTPYDPVAACSLTCREAGQAKVAQELAEEDELERRFEQLMRSGE